MAKTKFTYNFLVKLLSILCAVLPSVLAGRGCDPFVTILLSLFAAAAVLLLFPISEEAAKSSFVSSLVLSSVFLACVLIGVGHGATVAVVVLLLFLHLAAMAGRKYVRLRVLFRQQAVWSAIENHARLMYSLWFCILGVAMLVSGSVVWLRIPVAVSLAGLYVLLFIRSCSGRTFFLMDRQEKAVKRMIKGDLRACAPEPGAADRKGQADMVELYERVLALMETKKPFLEESYSLQDMAAAVYTNKTYLSQAINIVAGKNFRQFINHYRIQYSLELLKRDPSLKVEDLASMSGFHSSVTYNMAFKLNMGETPGEYSQRMRFRLQE